VREQQPHLVRVAGEGAVVEEHASLRRRRDGRADRLHACTVPRAREVALELAA
jgi:hypothetical protein